MAKKKKGSCTHVCKYTHIILIYYIYKNIYYILYIDGVYIYIYVLHVYIYNIQMEYIYVHTKYNIYIYIYIYTYLYIYVYIYKTTKPFQNLMC